MLVVLVKSMECDWAGCGSSVYKSITREHGSNIQGDFCRYHYYMHTISHPIHDFITRYWRYPTIAIAIISFYVMLKSQGIIP